MYRIGDVVYLSEKEKKELLEKEPELVLFQVYYVDKEEDVPSDYPYRFVNGENINLYS